MALELEGLEMAVAALNRALATSDDADFMRGIPQTAREVIKAGVIQHFEFTYELCWKFVKRWLETNVSPGVADGVSRRELYRMARENLLIADIDALMRHHEARNLTSHTYHANVADRVYAAAHEFAGDAAGLLAALRARND